jgi:hypothetical protein
MPRTPASRRALALLSALVLSPVASLGQEPKSPVAAPAPEAAPAPVAAQPSGDRIIYQVVPWVSGGPDTVTTTLEAVPVLARDGRPLLGESLYQALGRPDLVAEFRARQSRREVLGVVGAVVALGGLVYAVTRPQPDPSLGFDAFRRAANDQQAAQTAGLLVSLTGAVIITVGAFTDPNPVGEAERQRLIDGHNRALSAGRSGGARNADALAGDGPPRLSFQAGLLPGGGMAGFAVAF